MSGRMDAEVLITFARYLSWADLVRTAHEMEFRKRIKSGAAEPMWGPEFAWMSYWYSSLYVVIEAYDIIGLTDPVIDALLAHPAGYKDLLRRYRNGIFHYQVDLIDSRLLDLLNAGEEHVIWVYALHYEFNRLLRTEIAAGANTELKAETEAILERITGWLPEELEIRKFDITMERIRAHAERKPAPGLEVQHAEIREALTEMRALRRNCEKGSDRFRRALLRRLGVTLLDQAGG